VPGADEARQPPFLRAGRALLIFLAFLGAQVLGGLWVGIIAGFWIAIYGRAEGARIQPLQTPLAAIVGLVGGGLAVWALTWHSLRGPRRGEALRALGWSSVSRTTVLAACLTGLVLGFLLLFVVLPAFPPRPGHRHGPMASAITAGGWPRHAFAVLAVLVAPVVEELTFRGVLFGGLSRSWGTVPGGALVTLLFVVMHLPEVWGYVPAIAAVTVLGMVLLATRLATGSLLPAVALHAAYNAAVTLAMYVSAVAAGSP